MLCQISIKNFAIIENLELDLRKNMTVITGKTGAGKSIVIDALDVALGERADTKLIRLGAKQSEITITFDLAKIPSAKRWLSDKDLASDDECIVRRCFSAEGRSKNYINGTPVNLQQIKELGLMLVHVHGQHQHQTLVKRDYQLKLLDAYAHHDASLAKVRTLYETWRALTQKIETLQGHDTDHSATIELLTYQRQELEQLGLAENEVEKLHKEHRGLAHADTDLHVCQQLLDLTEHPSEPAMLNLLQTALQQLQSIKAPSQTLKTILELYEQASINLNEAYSELQHFAERIDNNPERLQAVESRLERIHDMARKHNVAPEDLCTHQAELSERLDNLKNSGQILQTLLDEQQVCLEHYVKAATTLSKKRKAAAKQIDKKVTQSLQHLEMASGKFAIDFDTLDPTQPHAHGLDRVEFMVTANPGQPLQPLAKVASGGELSRISLAIQVILAQVDETPTLIFDEVDVGIGGRTADIVGQLLRQLANETQVICITHLPQVASKGHHHLKIDKQTKNKKTQSSLQFLSNEERIAEIARMVGGVTITDQTLAHAKEMLANAL